MLYRSTARFVLGLGLISAAGCTPNGGQSHDQDIVLKFAAAVGSDTARCGQSYNGLGTSGTSAEILDLRLYISNIRLIDAAGREVALELDQDGKWQVENVALLDFEDGSGKCADAGNAEVNGQITGSVPEGEYTGLVFDLAVPFDLNHNDLAAAPAPLNVSAMYWAWSIGYKFLRVDVETDDNRMWSVHVGSTMCASSGPTAPPSVECGRPNRATVRFASFDFDHDTIEFNLANLFAGTDLTQDTPDSSAGCQSFGDDVNECTPVFPALGLDFVTGACTSNCTNQTVFRRRNLESSDVDRLAAIARGATLYSRTLPVAGGSTASCSACHGADGSGAAGPDVRPSGAGHLRQHAQGDGPHPDGVKFNTLTAADFDDLGAYLRSLCEADDDCEPESVDHGHEEHDDH